MGARKKFGVPYPNLDATPGFHKEADAFNRVQRGHQNMFETMPNLMAFAIIGGLKHPYACSLGATLFCVGSWLFLKGYADEALDVKTARYKKGGGLKHLGTILCMGCTISFAGSLLKWW